jgi:acyl carrier protein phosphodiesterase
MQYLGVCTRGAGALPSSDVNFFGHASVALWVDPDPRFLLGSMLPDFASMSRARLAGSRDDKVKDGITLHHQTDDAFHNAPTFLAIYAGGAEELEAEGLGRGPSRAVAHVGPELLLDGLLLERGTADRAYLDAVACLREDLGLSFSTGGDRFAALADRVAGHGLPNDYRSADGVFMRLSQALSRRPRLAISETDRRLVVPFLERTRATLDARLGELLDEIEAGLVDSRPSQRAILRANRRGS